MKRVEVLSDLISSWVENYEFSACVFSALLMLLSFSIFVHDAAAQTDLGRYRVNKGDCFSGVLLSHGVLDADYQQVRDANPHIEDTNVVFAGDYIFLVGVQQEDVLSEIDQRGCNAAANRAAGIRFQKEAEPEVSRRAVDSPTRVAVARSADLARPRVVTQARTVPAPIDPWNRTVAVKARGEPTRPVRAAMRRPLFAADEEYTSSPTVAPPPTGVSFAVNAIGAVAPGGQNVLVQEADQNFYLAPAPVPVAGSTQEQLPTDLERTIASGSTTASTSVGNLIIDRALFSRELASAGEDE